MIHGYETVKEANGPEADQMLLNGWIALNENITKHKVIIIDNGHGYNTPGKHSPDKRLMEWKWNRATAKILHDMLRGYGFDARLIVDEDEDISLNERVKRTNALCAKYGAKNCLFVSVHVNAAGNGEWKNVRGWSVWTTRGYTISDELAECMWHAAKVYFPDAMLSDMSDGDHDYEYGFAVCRGAKCAAVLCENFFMDNRKDCEWLLTDAAKDACAQAMADGIIAYIQEGR